jgi:hypothetical protein
MIKDRIIVAIVVVICIFILIASNYGKSEKVYDCRLADWHPDVPAEIKKQCRELRYEQWKNEQSKTQVYI